MKRILITGMSGVGKSAVIASLRTKAFACIDMDEPGWSYVDDYGHQRWHIDRLREAMHDASNDLLFVAGCSEDQALLYDEFAAVILLSLPSSTLLHRIQNRTENPYGKTSAELDYILQNLVETEPLLRKRCTHEIITTKPLPTVVDRVLDISCPTSR
jgi:broad-specificity NMP kinase